MPVNQVLKYFLMDEKKGKELNVTPIFPRRPIPLGTSRWGKFLFKRVSMGATESESRHLQSLINEWMKAVWSVADHIQRKAGGSREHRGHDDHTAQIQDCGGAGGGPGHVKCRKGGRMWTRSHVSGRHTRHTSLQKGCCKVITGHVLGMILVLQLSF